jgi:hypothetical protein
VPCSPFQRYSSSPADGGDIDGQKKSSSRRNAHTTLTKDATLSRSVFDVDGSSAL